MIEYRNLQEKEINRELFLSFIRHQTVVKCRRKENDEWTIKEAPFIDEIGRASCRERV